MSCNIHRPRRNRIRRLAGLWSGRSCQPYCYYFLRSRLGRIHRSTNGTPNPLSTRPCERAQIKYTRSPRQSQNVIKHVGSKASQAFALCRYARVGRRRASGAVGRRPVRRERRSRWRDTKRSEWIPKAKTRGTMIESAGVHQEERVSRAGRCRPRESGRSMGEGFPPNPKLVRDRARLSCFVDVYVHLQSHIPSHDGVRTMSDQPLLHPCAIGHCPPDLVLQGPLLHHDSTEQSATFCDMAGKAHTLQCQKPMHLSCACRHSVDRRGDLPKKPDGTAGGTLRARGLPQRSNLALYDRVV